MADAKYSIRLMDASELLRMTVVRNRDGALATEETYRCSIGPIIHVNNQLGQQITNMLLTYKCNTVTTNSRAIEAFMRQLKAEGK
jgi:hypothetical protein